MKAKTRVLSYCFKAQGHARMQRWADARENLAKAATYLMPMELEGVSIEEGQEAYEQLRFATRYVSQRYQDAFSPK